LPFKRILQRPFKTTTTNSNKKRKEAANGQEGIPIEERPVAVLEAGDVVKNDEMKVEDDVIIKNEMIDSVVGAEVNNDS
jgi:hypothetical protein